MVLALKLRKIGNSVGLVLPKEALAPLNAAESDTLVLTETTDGGFRVTPQSSDFEKRWLSLRA